MTQKCEPLIRGQRARIPPMPGSGSKLSNPPPCPKPLAKPKPVAAQWMSSDCVPVPDADTQALGGYTCNARVPVRVCVCAHVSSMFLKNLSPSAQLINDISKAYRRWVDTRGLWGLPCVHRSRSCREWQANQHRQITRHCARWLTIRGLMPYHRSQVHTHTHIMQTHFRNRSIPPVTAEQLRSAGKDPDCLYWSPTFHTWCLSGDWVRPYATTGRLLTELGLAIHPEA